jgi:hypothetical protein
VLVDSRAVAARPESARLGALIDRLTRADREALGIWALAHVALFLLAWSAVWVFSPDKARRPAGFGNWDAVWQQNIAAHGYFSGQSLHNSAAFFPGYPMVLAVAHVVLRNWVVSELVVSAVAGAVAVVALTRLAATSRAALVLVTMPAAVFLMVGYQEALFLAFAVPAWLAARGGWWWLAGFLAAAAGVVRPDGVWLTVALVVMALGSDRKVVNGARAAVGLAGPAAYEVYLWVVSGSPWTWSRAQQAGWGMHPAAPWKSWQATWRAAFEHPLAAGYALSFQLELLAMVAIAVAAVAFGLSRRWPEAVYCLLAAVAVGTQTWYMGVPRTLLVLFPVAVAVARWPRWGRAVWLAVCGPLAVVFGLLFLAGQWAG